MTEATGRKLFAATSQLVHLAGWMAGDEGNQGIARKYYAHSYRLAAEAGDAELSAIERGPDQPGESWAAHYSHGRWAHEAGMILAQLGDLDAAEEHLDHALNIAGLDRRRTRAIVLADLGQVHLKRGDIAAAFDAWNDFVDCADGIRSVKVGSAVQDMTAHLDRLASVSGVEELKEKAGNLWTPPAAA